MSKKTKPKKHWPTREEKAANKGKRFAGTRELLKKYGMKLEPKERTDKCNALGCTVKLKDPFNRKRWCPEHAKFTQRVRNLDATYKARGYSLKKEPPKRFNVKQGHLTVRARLLGVNEAKALAEYQKGERRLKAAKKARNKVVKKAAKSVAKKLAKAATKVVKSVPRPAKKVPAPKAGLKAMLNGKGADAQAAVAAHVAAKAAAAKA
ncbi:MAG TPA: hypothetical protein VHL57_08915 [Flavobacteriales bacterium]|nr:hypothetical protein [Flavobacteriales bacterium]